LGQAVGRTGKKKSGGKRDARGGEKKYTVLKRIPFREGGKGVDWAFIEGKKAELRLFSRKLDYRN